MKILYIGEADNFAKLLISRLEQESEEIYLVSSEPFSSSHKMQGKYQFYKEQSDPKLCRILFKSINPDMIIFAGNNFMVDVWNDYNSNSQYINTLHTWCDLCENSKNIDFIYLSSTQALGEKPKTTKGIQYALGEEMLSFYAKRQFKRVQTIYCDSIFSLNHIIDDGSFLSNIKQEVDQGKSIKIENDELIYPVYIGDVVDCILRTMLRQKSDNYVICSSNPIKKSQIYKYLTSEEIVVENFFEKPLEYSNEKAKEKLEWSDFHSLDKLLSDKKIKFKEAEETSFSFKKIFLDRSPIRKTIENIVLFLLFFALDYITSSNSVLSSVDVMTLYIVVVSAIYGVPGGMLGVILRAIGFWVSNMFIQVGNFDFQMYLETMIMIAQSVFITLVVAYPIDYLRSTITQKNNQISETEKQNEEIEDINDTNVLIKNEYQQRLLDSRNSFSVLHKTIAKINSLKSDRIFMEIAEVVAELIGTSTVSVYRFQNKGGYLRLVTKLNDESIFTGYSLNLNAYPDMKESIENGVVYSGNTWDGEPALVAPILHNMDLIAIIVINNLAFEKQTLYQINLLRTITALASDAMNKAITYEELVEDDLHIAGTSIFKCEVMEQKIAFAKEKAEKQLSNYALLQIEFHEKVEYVSIFPVLQKLIRKDDILGLGSNNELLLLLPSTPINNISFVINRFEQNNMKIKLLESDMPYNNG